MKHALIYALIILSLLLSMPMQAKDVVYYGGDNKSYNFVMLNHVLSYHPKKQYHLVIYPIPSPKQRAFDFLATNKGIDVVFGGATVSRQKQNKAIKIPLLKGLNGWRIPLVNSATPNLLKQQTSFNSFKKLLAGQYHLWSDVAILEANQINVHKATNPDGIFEMLSKQRLDYFPRSALEIWHEMEKYQHLNIAIEQHTLLYYPSAYYYYVNHQSTELAQDIKQGLEAAIQDGSFDKIFYQHFGSTISRVDPDSRKVYRLINPSLPAGAPLERSELWFDLSKLQ